MHPFSESIKPRLTNASANYGNIMAKKSEREQIERDVNAFIESGGKIEYLGTSFDGSSPKVKIGDNQGLAL